MWLETIVIILYRYGNERLVAVKTITVVRINKGVGLFYRQPRRVSTRQRYSHLNTMLLVAIACIMSWESQF